MGFTTKGTLVLRSEAPLRRVVKGTEKKRLYRHMAIERLNFERAGGKVAGKYRQT